MKITKIFNFKNSFLVLVFILIFCAILSFYFTDNIDDINSQDDSFPIVTQVVDGDTIKVSLNNKEYTIRYIGMDTPESVKPNTPVQCYAKEASEFNKNLVAGKKVRLESDVQDTDKYGRQLRYVYIDTNNDGIYDEMVNNILVQEGYARILTIPPDVKYKDNFLKLEKSSRENNKGLWKSCEQGNNISPTPILPPTSISNIVTSDCKIKGNISSSGDKIYHMPGQKYYNTVTVDINKGENYFCNEADAINAGYRKSKV